MIEKNISIKIFAKEMKTKDNKRTFLVYNYVNNNKWYDVKFSKNCVTPKTKGYHQVKVTKYFIKNNLPYNDILYICDVESIEAIPYEEKELENEEN